MHAIQAIATSEWLKQALPEQSSLLWLNDNAASPEVVAIAAGPKSDKPCLSLLPVLVAQASQHCTKRTRPRIRPKLRRLPDAVVHGLDQDRAAEGVADQRIHTTMVLEGPQ